MQCNFRLRANQLRFDECALLKAHKNKPILAL